LGRNQSVVVIRKSDGKKITVPDWHFATTDPHFEVEKPAPKRKRISSKTK